MQTLNQNLGLSMQLVLNSLNYNENFTTLKYFQLDVSIEYRPSSILAKFVHDHNRAVSAHKVHF